MWIFSDIIVWFKDFSDSSTTHSEAPEVHQQDVCSWPSWIKTHLLCSARMWKSLPSSLPLSSYIDFLHHHKKRRITGPRPCKKGKVIRSACNPVRAFQAAVLSILFGYVKNVEYQQWVSVPYCWVLYELILLQSQKKKRKERPTAWTKKSIAQCIPSSLYTQSQTGRVRKR